MVGAVRAIRAIRGTIGAVRGAIGMAVGVVAVTGGTHDYDNWVWGCGIGGLVGLWKFLKADELLGESIGRDFLTKILRRSDDESRRAAIGRLGLETVRLRNCGVQMPEHVRLPKGFWLQVKETNKPEVSMESVGRRVGFRIASSSF